MCICCEISLMAKEKRLERDQLHITSRTVEFFFRPNSRSLVIRLSRIPCDLILVPAHLNDVLHDAGACRTSYLPLPVFNGLHALQPCDETRKISTVGIATPENSHLIGSDHTMTWVGVAQRLLPVAPIICLKQIST